MSIERIRPDKITIINHIVQHAADVMEAKAEYNELVAEQMEEKGDWERGRVERLHLMNKRILDAVALIRENEGCWN